MLCVYLSGTEKKDTLPDCAFLNQVWLAGLLLGVTRDCVTHAEANDKAYGNHGKAGREVDDRAFRVAKSKHSI